MIPVNIDLLEDAKDLIPYQFNNSLIFNELLDQDINQLQLSNNTVFDILNNLNVENATGYLLDCVGSYVAVLRNGDNDDDYRERIKRKILTASSEGTPNELLELLSIITKGNTKIWEHFPVSCSFSSDGTIFPSSLPQAMQDASPACSGEVIIYIDSFKNSFVPTELGFSAFKLANEDLNPFITDASENIVVNNLIYTGEGDEFAELSEFCYGVDNGTESFIDDGKGILCEVMHNGGGVTFYNHDYVALDNAINRWYEQMNIITPSEFL